MKTTKMNFLIDKPKDKDKNYIYHIFQIPNNINYKLFYKYITKISSQYKLFSVSNKDDIRIKIDQYNYRKILFNDINNFNKNSIFTINNIICIKLDISSISYDDFIYFDDIFKINKKVFNELKKLWNLSETYEDIVNATIVKNIL